MTKSFPVDNALDPRSDTADGFKVWFPDHATLDEKQREELARLAHRELYFYYQDKHAAPEASLVDMRKAIEAAKGFPNIRIEVVLINQDNRTGSFVGKLGKIAQFLPGSKDRFVKDAIKELKELGDQRSERGSQLSKNKFSLCCALLRAEEHIEGENKEALDALKRSSRLSSLFEFAREKIDEDGERSEKKYFYDGNDERRSRDGGRD